jgi:hypothetical protein
VFGTILVIVFVLTLEADEGEATKSFLLELDERSNISVRQEHGGQLFISPFFGVVLNVEVVEKVANLGAVSGVPLDSEDFISGVGFTEGVGGFGSSFFGIEAYKAIAT